MLTNLPQLKFKINHKKDLETLTNFIKEAKYDNGRNLDWLIFNKYPELKNYWTGTSFSDQQIIDNFVINYYKQNKLPMIDSVKKQQINWKEKEPSFFKLVTDLFPDNYWSSGKYIAYLTIWGMYPRFLKDKTFQIPYQHKIKGYTEVVIAHEMLHFIFYNYFAKNYPNYKEPETDFFVWQISEIFNTFIQNSKEWLAVFEVESMGYPEHETTIKKLHLQYSQVNKANLDDFINNLITIVNNDNKLIKD